MTETLPDFAAIVAEFTPERLNAMSMEERLSDPMKAFSRRRHDDGAAHVTWWLWRTQERNQLTPLKPSQGSMFFLDCGRGAFAVTADHVYDGLLEDRDERRGCSCQIGNVCFDKPGGRPVARGERLGVGILAVFAWP